MNKMTCTAALVFTILFFTKGTYSQQYEDIVYLKNGSTVHGIITEQVPGESIKIKTKDGNTFVFKMDEIEKLAKEEIVIKKEEVKIDSVKTKSLKSETTQSKEKQLTAKNSITIQPIGLLTLLTNIEFDRALSGSVSMGLKVSFMTFFIRNSISFEGNPKDVEDAESMKQSLSAWGIGTHLRLYPGGRAVEGFFLGLALEKLTVNFDEVNDIESENRTFTNKTVNMFRLEFEIGDRIKLSNRVGGFTLLWSLGAGVGFGSTDKESFTIPLGSIGFGMGYSF